RPIFPPRRQSGPQLGLSRLGSLGRRCHSRQSDCYPSHGASKQGEAVGYLAAFQALENFLKAFLLNKGATLDQVRDIGPNLRVGLLEAKAKGLVLKVDPAVEEAVMKLSDYYTHTKSLGSGEWTSVSPHLVISFADQVRRDA